MRAEPGDGLLLIGYVCDDCDPSASSFTASANLNECPRLGNPDRDHASWTPVYMKESAHSCEECGGMNCVWFAESRLWNEVMGGDPDKEASGMLCPSCFANRADAHFATSKWEITGWQLIPEMRRR